MSDKPRKIRTAQSKFRMLIANLRAGSDPSQGTSGNPDVIRSTYTQQHFPELSGRGQVWGDGATPPKSPGVSTRHASLLSEAYTAASVQVTVANNDFSFPAHLHLGGYTFTSGVHYTVGVDAATTAASLAAAINSTPDFRASAVGAVITVTGPFGPNVNAWQFEAVYEGVIQNLIWVGTFEDAEPRLAPPDVQ